MIKTEDLSKKFDAFQAVEGVTLQVKTGEVLALLGPNGAGKTTTVRMLTSVLRPSRGSASVAGFDIVSQAPQVRASVGVLTEHHGLYNRMDAMDYLLFFGEIYGLDEKTRTHRAEKVLSDFGLAEAANRRIGEFSKGMRQKLALGRAMLHNPPVLLLDEPTSAMDPESAHLVRKAIQELKSNERAVVICTHNLAEAEELADRIAIIRRGKIIANDTTANLKMRLLGPPEYEVRMAEALNGQNISLPDKIELTLQGENWIRFSGADPDGNNPKILRSLLDQGLRVVSMQEVPRSLEQVYLQAVADEDESEVLHAG